MNQEEYDESEHSKESYAHFGLAVYYSQVLEHQLVNMIVMLRKTQGLLPTESDLDALYERKFSITMGRLINEIKQLFLLDKAEIDELTQILKLRNFIVHDFFKERISLTFTRTGRDKIINDLQEFVDRVRKIDKKLEKYTDELNENLGITQEFIESEMRKHKEEIVSEELKEN